jgi:ABC-type transport system involved in cytochrome c biogenesis permease subunit
VPVLRWLRRHYGAGPLHLLALIACVAFVGYVVTRIQGEGGLVKVAIWFVLALVLHDLVIWPLYALADRGALRLARRHPDRLPRVPWINYVRVPAIMSAVLLFIAAPLILRRSEAGYYAATGLTESVYVGRWLLVTAALFAVSAVLYAARLALAARDRTG